MFRPIQSSCVTSFPLTTPVSLKSRQTCQEFLDWLLQQRRGQVTVNNVAEREDVTEALVKVLVFAWPNLERIGRGQPRNVGISE
jgi:hypothetical protein